MERDTGNCSTFIQPILINSLNRISVDLLGCFVAGFCSNVKAFALD